MKYAVRILFAAFLFHISLCAFTADYEAEKGGADVSSLPGGISGAFERLMIADLEIPLCAGSRYSQGKLVSGGSVGDKAVSEAPGDHHVYYYQGFAICYREKYEQAEWTAYELTSEELTGDVPRSDNFRADNRIKTGSASAQDYRGSGYDRGHLVPAADMAFSAEAMSESFLMSNMSPQRPPFNRGIWNSLESLVRDLAREKGSLYVISGPVLEKETYPVIGLNGVAVPEYYYKVILHYSAENTLAAAFIIPNGLAENPLYMYAVPVDEAERRTGLDFFSLLPDSLEDRIEGGVSACELFLPVLKAAARCYAE